jgi:hypothetical protein
VAFDLEKEVYIDGANKESFKQPSEFSSNRSQVPLFVLTVAIVDHDSTNANCYQIYLGIDSATGCSSEAECTYCEHFFLPIGLGRRVVCAFRQGIKERKIITIHTDGLVAAPSKGVVANATIAREMHNRHDEGM